MNIDIVRASLGQALPGSFDFYERRPGDYQLRIPIFHEDGDMVDIYLLDSPKGEEYVRICDFGLALMRLSYTFEISSPTRQRIFDGILHNCGVSNEEGNLYLDAPMDRLYEGILQFAGCVQKICNMRYWSREVVRSTFYEDLGEYVTTEMQQFSPIADHSPLPEHIIGVDWSLKCNNRDFYLFGVRGNDKAKVVAIALLEFQKARLPFISLVVHENMEELGTKETVYLTRNTDSQYPILSDFKERGTADIERLAGAA